MSCEEGRALADHLGVAFLETSASRLINVQKVFDDLIDAVCNSPAFAFHGPGTMASDGQLLRPNSVDLRQRGKKKSCMSWLKGIFSWG